MTDLKVRNTSAWILLIAIPVMPFYIIGFFWGMAYSYLYGGYAAGSDFLAKIAGFETSEEIINRIVDSKLKQQESK